MEDDEAPRPLCLDLGTLHWRVGLCGDDAPSLDTSLHAERPAHVPDQRVAAHPFAAELGLEGPGGGQPGLSETEPYLARRVLERAIANAPGARQCLWELHCEMLEGALRETYQSTTTSRDVICTLPLFTEPDSAAMTERLRVFFDDSGPFRRAGFEVEKLLFAHPEVLALYATGRTAGLSVNLGSNITAMAVYEGYLIESASRSFPWPRDADALMPQLVSMIIEAIEACPPDAQKDLATNIVRHTHSLSYYRRSHLPI